MPGHKKTLVDVLPNIFSEGHKESLVSVNAPEAGTQALSASSRVNLGEGEVRVLVPPMSTECFEARRLTSPARMLWLISIQPHWLLWHRILFCLEWKHFKDAQHY